MFLRKNSNTNKTLIIVLLIIAFLLLKLIIQNLADHRWPSKPKTVSHVSYVHYLDTKDTRTIDNFKFFIHFAYAPCHPEIDFTITLNTNMGSSLKSLFQHMLFIDAFSNHAQLFHDFVACQSEDNPMRNTRVILRRNMRGGDLCAHADLVQSGKWREKKSKYAYYFFINSSVRGPFLPNYWLRKW